MAASTDKRSSRPFWPLVFFLGIALLIFARLGYLTVVKAPEYSAMASEARTVSFPIEPRRGTIYDRNGTVLAVSVEATTIYANPVEIDDPAATAAQLASVLGGKMEDFLPILTANKTNYSVIERKADVALADKVKELDLDGIYFVSESRREYPHGQVAGQIIGACSIGVDEENNREYYYGVSGLEAYYDDILSGEVGYYEAERGRDGSPIPGGVHESVAAVDGQDIIISIDLELQEALEKRLVQGIEDLDAESGSALVMDGGSGEIYAAASLPLFNPADRSEVEEGATKLKCVTDLFEPGSIFKSVSTMALLETNTMSPDDELFCPASITADGYTISDAHERGDETFTLRQILDQSSNVGISLAVESMGFDKLYNHIIDYNLHSTTGVDYPGEGEVGTEYLGNLPAFDNWSRVTGYNISFGQGLSVTPLQITRFYGALVNDGVECTPHFLVSKPQSGEVVDYPTEDVIANKAAIPTITSMLQTVVTDGTGKRAAIEGFDVAGKTSTAEIYDEENGGYREGVYNLAFTGFLANSSSQLVCFVGANEVPDDSSVTPLFKDIMTTAIDRFRISPDK
ncbi:peptidoglycan D,D-transpeptidase FtsI family protein [Adlercreutzia agrestimuris]|uniref:peptidoglycan D,D-transpeptidase FtsI family protein n=1 Tax=Adlercreutzia agrestimuris TaxID=2941324 RepID=UPI002040864D|nr:penicillin-binding protein 2 [Adlercreutzia agrestimuris]